MMRFLPILRLSIIAALGFAAGCTSRTPPGEEKTSPVAAKAQSPAVGIVHYKVTGVVRRVKPDSGQVVIAHDAIPGFMNAMTMPFTLKDHSLLDDVQPDDQVEGQLRVEKEGKVVKDYELTDLVVTRPALPVPKRLTLSTKDLTLREAPKRLEPGQMVPDFTMTTQEGRTVTLSDLRGDVVVLTFIYTRCPLPDYCPLMDRKFAELAGKLAASPKRASRVRLLSLSFDPEHDTPEVLRKHAEVQGGKPPLWTFAVASHDELAKVAGPLGLTYGPTSTEIIHNLSTAVIDPEGRLARLEVGREAKNLPASELFKFIAPLVPETPKPAPKS
jgi:protein SCO1/2